MPHQTLSVTVAYFFQTTVWKAAFLALSMAPPAVLTFAWWTMLA